MTSRLFTIAGTLIGASGIRRISRRSGATDEEFYERLPGDELLAHPMIEWTRATTIPVSRSGIWPWLVQMGYGRGGWYTSPTFDRIVWGIENLSSEKILPEWQGLKVGDIVPDGPDFAAFFRVERLEPPETIVYRSIRHPYRGHPVDPRNTADLSRVERELREQGVFIDFSWAFVLRDLSHESTRLIVRTRADVGPAWTRLAEPVLGLVDFYHVSTMFSGIRRRASMAYALAAEGSSGS